MDFAQNQRPATIAVMKHAKIARRESLETFGGVTLSEKKFVRRFKAR